jgi:peptidyl-prolyl cis-trans isomerase SurA
MKKINLSLLLVLSLKSLSAIEVLDRVAVIVDDGVIMESQIKTNLKEMIGRFEEQNLTMPSMEVLKDQIIETLIIEELQLQMADRAGVRISDSELNDAIARIAQNNNMGIEEFMSFMAGRGSSYEDFREKVRQEMIIQRVQRGRVASEINITEQEFEAYLQTDDSLNELEPELMIQQILVKNLGDADRAINRIKNGEDFSSITKEISISSNAALGGMMQWRKIADMPELFVDAVSLLGIGDYSKPLESGAGYHILKLIDKRGPFVEYQDQWLSRHILLTPSAIRTEEETKTQLNSIRSRIIDGEDFGNLADEFSEDPGSAKKGGDLGWLGMGVLADEFERTMIESDINEISEVFETQFGFHFLEVIDKRNHDMTRENIENRAYDMLYSRKYDEELENTLRVMRAEAFIEVKDLD